MIALWIHYKRRGAEFTSLSVKLLLEYAVFAVCNVPLTKIGVVIVKWLLGKEILIDSGYYTLLAILSAVVLPYLLDSAREAYRDREKILKMWKARLKKRSLTYKHKLSVSLLLVLLIVVAYVIRGPIEIYAGNVNEFLFTLGDFLPWLLVIGVVILVVVGCLHAFLPDVPFCVASVLLLWFGVASWIQDLFLNIKLAEGDGGPLVWDSLGSFPLIDLVIWLALLVGALLLCIRFRSSWLSVCRMVAGALCLVQLIAVSSVLLTMPERKPADQVLSGDDQMRLASKENVIVLIMDSVGVSDLSRMMEQYPEARTIMKDFTLYDNACCDYYRTFPSITHLLTGNEVDFQKTAEGWMRDSWNSDRCNLFYRKLKENDYKCRLYVDSSWIGWIFGNIRNLAGKFDNVQEAPTQTDTIMLLKKLLSLSTFRYVPYVWKAPFEILTADFHEVVAPVGVKTSAYSNVDFYQRLIEEGLSQDPKIEKLFKVDYIEGIHSPSTTSAQATYEEGASVVDATRGLFTIIEEYFSQMKELGLYDDATIIIISDHTMNFNDPMASMLYLKRAGETREETEINSAPVSYNDFQSTILELIGENDGSFGPSFFDWRPGEERRRVLYLNWVDENAPEVVGAVWNQYRVYSYYTDAEEVYRRYLEGEPDLIIPTLRWELSGG